MDTTRATKTPRAGDQPVAIVGVSCRLPGAADPDAFWRLLTDGRSTVGRVPDRREAAGGSRGGFIEGVDRFDAAFFGITPREAGVLDPQQRLMLELAWEAFEDARIVAAELSGSATGVFVGAMRDDYALLAADLGRTALNHHAMAGLSRGVIANRVSHVMGLRGPSLVIDTGQASSLVAVHTAMESLRRGESTLALAGGVNLNLAAGTDALAQEFGGLSPDGRCYTFDHRANGFVRGEGGVALVLRLLPDAVAAGDRVYGVIHGGAVNNDGAAEHLTTPSRDAQSEVLRQAYASAGVAPESVQYVELHGTGTPVGDPVEAAALGAVLGSARDTTRPLLVGSVKTNLGHLEAAAGAVGLLKTVLALKHGHIPASLNFEEPNPSIPLAELNLRVVGDPTEWPDANRPRIAGVSSFGMGGTNCHLVLSQGPAPASASPAMPPAAPPVVPWVLSGRGAAALRGQAEALHSAVGGADAYEVGWSLATTRTRFEHRAVVVGGDTGELSAGLDSLARGEWLPSTVSGTARDGLTGFVFSGQGGQRVGMGRELAEAFPVFAAALDEVCGHFDGLREVMFTDAEALGRTGWAQPALFAVEVALFRLVESWGVRPDYLVGHSVGELAAAHVAGVFSLADACKLVAARAGLMQALPAGGAMWAVRATLDEVTPLLVEGVSVAAVNAPGQVVLSGAREAVEAVASGLADRQGRWLEVSHAFHSVLMDPMLDAFRAAADAVTYEAPRIPIVSTLTGEPVSGFTASYWVDQVRGTVRFADAITHLTSLGVTRFLELGPDAGLVAAIGEIHEGSLAVAALNRKQSEPATAVTALARLWTDGVDVDWTALFPGAAPATVDLPTYAFQRRRHWFDTVAEPTADEEAVTTAAAARLAAARSQDERRRVLLDLIRVRAAAVLGHEGAEAIPARTPFKDIGFDSLSLVRLRERIGTDLDVELPSTLLFDHPTPERLAGHLLTVADTAADGPTAVAAERPAYDDPIAIIGMGCRFPGGVRTPEELWELLRSGTDAITPLPTDRGWDLRRLADADAPGGTATRAGGFLRDAAEFDADFFGIDAREALAMDPQQRLLLETSWEALERAGIDPGELGGTRTGVFVGAMPQEYGPRLHEAPEGLAGYALTGTTGSTASGRISYTLGLEGPAITVDTACSAALVALHLAVQSLRGGECTLALAGAATVMSAPGILVEFGGHGIAADGRCKSFSDTADGTGWAEGVGTVVLERLSDARRNGHQVLAVVAGTAVNQNGTSNGLTAPNGLAQQRVIRQALAAAGLRPQDVDAVEAHGTGTVLGDPIEANALIDVYGQGRTAERPLWLGSLKSNIGHTQAAAGLGGVMKLVLAMRHGLLPRTLHAGTPSSYVDWSDGGVSLLTEPVPWATGDRTRRAGVSAFGVSGTNAHVILAEPAESMAPDDDGGTGVLPYVLSARTPAALREQARGLRAAQRTTPAGTAYTLADTAYTLAVGRSRFAERAVLFADDATDLDRGLAALAEGRATAGLVRGTAGSSDRVVFVLPEHGEPWTGRTDQLPYRSPAFAERLAQCDQAAAEFVDFSVADVLMGADGAPSADRADVAPFVSWAVMISLAELWQSRGVRPDAVVGSGWGEVAAACVEGALSLRDGARIVAEGGRSPGTDRARLSGPADEHRSRLPHGTARFEETLANLYAAGRRIFLDAGQNPTPAGTLPDDAVVIGPAHGPDSFRESLARLYVHGVAVDWAQMFVDRAVRRIELPTYPFDRQRYWWTPSTETPAPRADDDCPDPAPHRQTDDGRAPVGGLRARLAGVPEDREHDVVLDFVREHTAQLLGQAEPQDLAADRTFKDLGLSSRNAVELRARLARATGAALTLTVAFDHPTPTLLAEHLLRVTYGTPEAPAAPEPVRAAAEEPLAIVGMACRLPGDVDSPDALWQLLMAGGDATGPLPSDRGWDLDALYDPDPDRPGTSYVRAGGFLSSAAEFDHEFFGISAREALAMDPQQRLLMQTAWAAFENAGLLPDDLRGTDTGVFAGVMPPDYGRPDSVPDELAGYQVTGGAPSVASGRLAYHFGFTGPAVSIDTACSGSLVALHIAAQSLASGECELALVAGVSVTATPTSLISFSRLRALSADGRCHAFAEDADGFGMAEGVGVLLVERLSAARRNGHRVLALVRGSAINQDGASNGLTAPNGLSQQRVIRQALNRAGLGPADVDAVEAHGTGTPLGDPIEAQALMATYGDGRPAERPLWLGSAKSNVGHTQAAAGVVGVIKMVQALRHGTLPSTLHVAEPSSRVDWESGGVRLLAASRPWPEADRPRRAGVSAFGISGTNAHVILEQAPEPEPEPAAGSPSLVPWLLSARDPQVLRDQAAALGTWAGGGVEPAPVGRELATARTRFEHRAVVVGEYAEGLRALAAGEPSTHVVSGVAGPLGRTVFVFPGQGAQWVGMGAGLLESSKVFARTVAQCEEALSDYVDWSLTEVLRGAEGAASLDRVDVVQPASFAVMVALAAVWRANGVEPDAVVGHSQGEIAAACVAGALSLRDAARVVCLRSKALTALAGRGAMAIVAVPEEQADDLVSRFEGRLSVAAVNGPGMVVLSGDPAALDDVSRECEERGVRVRRISVDYASHSVHVEEILDELAELLAPVRPLTPQVPFFSTVTADWIESPALDAAYWGTNLRRPVRFAEAVRTLAGQGHGLFVECSPHPVLLAATEETLAEHDDACAVGSLRRHDGGPDRLLLSLAEAWVRGAPVDFGPSFPGESARTGADLPTYPFRRRRHWLETPAHAVARQEAAVIDSWRYRVDWTPVPDAGEPALTGDWLVLTPASPQRNALVEKVLTGLARHGAVPHAVAVDDLAREGAVLPDRIEGILSLAALDERPCDEEPGVTAGLADTVAAVRALAGRAPGAPLWLATSGAVGTAPQDPVRAPLQAQVWGLGVVLGLEDTDRACGLVDLPGEPGEDSLARLATVLSGATGEHEVAVRDNTVSARRLVLAPAPDAEPWRPRDTVLITGGTGVLGAHVARWAARHGASHLVLTSRLGPDAPGAAELSTELTGLGARVTVAACDVADADQLAALLATVDDAHPLSAVVHAAGVTHPETPVADLSTAGLAHVLRAKTEGARNLDTLTEGLDLDAFVLFSSGAGVWGDVGKAGYAAANAYLDAFAAERRARGAVATSVAWGAWDGGMSEGDDADLFTRRGVRLMRPERAVRALARAVGQGDTTVAVADFDLARFLPLYTMTRDRRLVTGLSAAQQTAQPVRSPYADGAEPAQEPSTSLADRLAGLPEEERESALTDLVRSEAAVVLKADGPESVRPRSTFKELGFDSLTALEFRNRLTVATGLKLPASLIFDHPTPVALVRHLSDELFGGADDVLAELDRMEARLSALPDEECDRLALTDRLRALLRRVERTEHTTAAEQGDDDLATASNDEIFDLIDRELGIR
ncbi:SDR family NAD(P)-dependent oxidoreductase [Streptomyces sp. NPDC002932]|uniref:SDR family NAD(P)-dependent oxidoreductase n=1 Tax=Streptomyces sp. NPDC002932 TaxID=3364672 RepID=UPI003688E5CD